MSSEVSISLTALDNIKIEGSDFNSDIDDLGKSVQSLVSKDS